MNGENKSPLIFWHLLSLDAPSVAALWTWFLARANKIALPWTAPLAMAVAVWVLYAADRLLDTEDLELRHRFHHRHRTAFLTGIFVASIALAVLLPHISSESMHRYLILGGLVFAYFVMIHATRSAHRLPKELAVGICFAAAVFIPTISRRPDLRLPLLVPAVLFAALCSLNCLFIYAWEHADKSPNHPPHTMTQFALGHLVLLAAINIAASVALATFDRHCPWPIPAATAFSTALLLALHLLRTRYVSVTLRAAADLTLLTPLIFLPLLWADLTLLTPLIFLPLL